jgi:hypothetical protein
LILLRFSVKSRKQISDRAKLSMRIVANSFVMSRVRRYERENTFIVVTLQSWALWQAEKMQFVPG